MATKAQYAEFFSKYNPSGGGAEEWNLWCQAFVARCSNAHGTWRRTYPTARAARLASGALNGNLSSAPLGAIGWWEWGTQDHVAVYMGDGVWMMGSRHVSERIGGVARNAGFVTHADFQARAGLKFLGWSLTNGGNVIPVERPALAATERQAVSAGANVREAPTTTAKIVRVLGPDQTADFEGWVNGDLANGKPTWLKVKGKSEFIHISAVTPPTTIGLVDLVPKPPAPAPAPAPALPPGPSLSEIVAAIKPLIPTAKQIAEAVIAEQKLPGN